MPPGPLLLALYDALILEYLGGPRTDSDHRKLYDLVARAERNLPPNHPALGALRHYQDEALKAIEAWEHGPLLKADGPNVFVWNRDHEPDSRTNFHEALRRAIVLENDTPTA